jgi:MFS family permease
MIVPIEQRSSAFGALNSGAMVGSAMGPIMAGTLAAVSLRGAFLLSTGIFFIGLLERFPISLHHIRRRRSSWRTPLG